MRLPGEIERLFLALARVLDTRGHSAELVVLGGASLVARGLSSRATSDVDVLGVRLPDGTVQSAYPLPAEVRAAADEVATVLGLDPMWLDDRPGSDFHNAAPAGFETRLERTDYGPLVVWHLSSRDIAAIKIVASAERWGEPDNKHWEDVQQLQPDSGTWSLAEAFAARIWSDHSAAWVALDEIKAALRV